MEKKKVCIVVFTEGRLPTQVYEAIRDQDYPNMSVLISVRKPDPNKNKQDNIIEHMNYSRQLAKATDADYFFFVESSVVIPKDAVSNLMIQLEQPPFKPELWKHLEATHGPIKAPPKKHIIGGWYRLEFPVKEDSEHWEKLVKLFGPKPECWSASRWIADNIIVSLMHVERSVVRVDKISSGCLMMSREVLEKIEWRSGANIAVNFDPNEVSKDGMVHATGLCMCGAFGIDAQDAGYDLWMDGSVVCEHLTVPNV